MTLEYALKIAPQFYPLAAVLALIILFIVMAWKLGTKNKRILALTEMLISAQDLAMNAQEEGRRMEKEKNKRVDAHKLIGKDMRVLRKEREEEQAAHKELVEERDRYRRMTDVVLDTHDKIVSDDNS